MRNRLPNTFPRPYWALLSALVVLLASGCGEKKRTDGVVGVNASKVTVKISPFDPEAPLPSPGVAALQALAKLEPGVAVLLADVEAAERAALKAGIAKMPSEPGTKKTSGKAPVKTSLFVPAGPVHSKPALAAGFSWISSVHAAEPSIDSLVGGNQTASVMMGVVVGLGDIFVDKMEAGMATDKSATITKDGTKSTMSLDIGKKDDGSSNFGIGLKTEASKNDVSASSDFKGSVNGKRCPDADGKVDFVAKLRLAAGSGGTEIARDLTAHITATVNDDANLVTSAYDLVQGTRRVQGGRQVYVETGYKFEVNGEDVAHGTSSNLRMIRHSSQANLQDVSELSESGHDAALSMGVTALVLAEQNWKKGGCTKIVADSPGKVDKGAVKSIPVTVRHRFDSSELPSKLEVKLTGEKSVDPTLLPKTPGTLRYTAPDKKGKATIALTATSRRGRATLDLNATTGGNAYSASGRHQEATFSGVICDLEQPFELDIGGGAKGKFKFTPTAGAPLSGGKTEYSGTYAMGRIYGNGTYTIQGDPASGKGLTLVESGKGCATTPMGPTCANESEKIKLTPADGAACAS